MLSYKEFRELVLESTIDNWTHKLDYGELTPEMRIQVDTKHQKSINKPSVGDKYQYHFNIISPPNEYTGTMPYGVYSHRSIKDKNAFSSSEINNNDVYFRDAK
jgi:hypothetical protein